VATLPQILGSSRLFSERLYIKNKKSKLVRFGDVMTQEQYKLLDVLDKHKRVAVIKSRQLGATTLVRSHCFHSVYTSPHPVQSAVISNKFRSSCALLQMDRTFFKTLPRELKRPVSMDKVDRFTFASTDAGFMAFSSQSDSQDRGYTFDSVHMSEFAFFENAGEVLSSWEATADEGRIIIESTPNHYGDELHTIALDSMYNDSWRVVMLSWFSFPAYSRELPKGGFDMDGEEEVLMEQYKLTPEQVFWRRAKIETMKSKARFQHEYPVTIEEAYSLSEANYFSEEELQNIEMITYEANYKVWFGPRQDESRYSIGVDVAGGVGKDYSVAYAMEKGTNMPTACLSSNTISVRTFAEDIAKMSHELNEALVTFELNNHGHALKEVFDSLGFINYRPFKTTMKSKVMLYDMLRAYVHEDLISTLDNITYTEMRNLVNDERGFAPDHPPGQHDDRVIALMLALHGLKEVKLSTDSFDRYLANQALANKPKRVLIHPLRR
jgi:hypothetical protein